MSIERAITKRLFENRKLNENWPPILNNLSKYTKGIIRKELLKKGYDIQNTPSTLTKITSGRDPRLKSGFVVFLWRGNPVGAYVDGEKLFTEYIRVDSDYVDLNKLSWSKILAAVDGVYYMPLDQEASTAMKDKQTARRQAQQGQVIRYNNKRPDGTYNKSVSVSTAGPWSKYIKVDKSGYEINPDKYKDMLADLQIPRATELLKQAKDVYTKLAPRLGDFIEDYKKSEEYEDIMRAIPRLFRELDKKLKEYEKTKKDYGVEFADIWDKAKVTEYIKTLKKYINSGKKLLQS